MFSTFWEDHCVKKQFFEKNHPFFWQYFQNCISHIQTNFLVNKLVSFWDFQQRIFGLCTKIFDGLSRLHSKRPGKRFGNFCRENLFFLFFGFERKIFWTLSKNFGSFVKTAFYVSRRTFWGQKIVNMFTSIWQITEKKGTHTQRTILL